MSAKRGMTVEKHRSVSENVIVEVLSAHADHLVGDQVNGEEYLNLFPAYRAELAPLIRIAERIKATLVPVTPAPAFTATLKQDLLAAALQRAEKQRSHPRVSFFRRRGFLLGAAALGSVLSVAGVVAALLWRQRSMARA